MAPVPVKPLKTEKEVKLHPIPVGWRDAQSVPYKVKDSDTWITVAREHNLDVQRLIHFNFHTNDPGEVNWYLRRNVGCRIATPDGLNWTFEGADPGYIALPLDVHSMQPTVLTAKKTISPLALEFEGPSAPLKEIGKVFDGLTLVQMAAAIAGVAAGEALLLALGIVAAPFAPFVLMGGMHEAALNELRKREILEGLALGIVLTADGRSVTYIKDHRYVKTSPVRDINYPQYGKQLQGLYNQSLVSGIIHGREFNSVAVHNLFKFLGSQMTDYAKAEYNGRESHTWDSRKWEHYYRLCGRILERKIRLT